MKIIKWLAIGLIGATALASDAPRGTVPKVAADKYAAHADQNGFSIGATLLTAGQAKKTFATEIDRCCMVVEVALFPQKDGLTEVSLGDFALRIVGKDIATRPSSAEVVAGKLQRMSEPKTDGHDVAVYPSGGVGVQTGGIDPVTGQPRRGGVTTTTSAGVGVGVGGPPQPPQSQPGLSDADRRTMELELKEKGLPEGNTANPVSGYLYFSLPQHKNSKYQLEYMVNGNKITLDLR
jgi:hypothetical protein